MFLPRIFSFKKIRTKHFFQICYGIIFTRDVTKDLDECASGLAACFHGASCVNTLGSYKCVCGSGYHEVDGVCEDIDECLSNGRVNR